MKYYYQVRYRSEMFGTIALHSNHATKPSAEAAAMEFRQHVQAQNMNPQSKAHLLKSISVTHPQEQ